MSLLQFCVIFCLTILDFAHCNTYTTPSDSCAFINEAHHFLEHENELLRQRIHKYVLSSFNYSTNITNFNSKLVTSEGVTYAAASKDLSERIQRAGYDKINDDEFIKRQVRLLADLGSDILPKNDYEKLSQTLLEMTSNYAIQDNKYTLISDKEESKGDGEDAAKLAVLWAEKQDAVGTAMRNNFRTYVELSNKAARLNDYTSHAEYWLRSYENNDFEKNIDAVYEAIYPLYRELHGYVRHHLRKQYGSDVVSPTGNIPEHLKSKINKHINLYLPFPEKPQVNITKELLRQNFTVTRIIEYGDAFFKSLNMRPLPENFWKFSVVEQRPNVSMQCHPVAWYMYDNDSDVRITMCAKVNQFAWEALHHELGHCQYNLQYESQPTVFRQAPHPGFQEAIGDTILLSVMSQRHLKKIGFENDEILDEESRINKLFQMALQRMYHLPLFYSVDKWRLQVFRNEIDESVWNCAYWKYKSKYAGLEPAVLRTDNDFDPPAIYHVNIDMDLLRYFTATVFQFQFHKSLCLKAGQYKPNSTEFVLDNCDIYESKEAGETLAKFLSLGASKHWKVALEELTGETTMNPTAMLEYFKPLYEWLQRENRRLNITVGWNITDKVTCQLSV